MVGKMKKRMSVESVRYDRGKQYPLTDNSYSTQNTQNCIYFQPCIATIYAQSRCQTSVVRKEVPSKVKYWVHMSMNEISSVTTLDMSKTHPHFWELVRKSRSVQHVGHHTIPTQGVQGSRERESFRPEVLHFAGPCEGIVIP